MKKLNFKWIAVVAIAVILGSVFFTSCSKNEAVLDLEVESRRSDRQETIFLFPEGTRFNPSRTADNEIDFILPKEYEFITLNTDQTRVLSVTNRGTITCDCTSGDGGCKPFAAGDYIGCFTEGCTTCVGTSSNSSTLASSINFIKVPISTKTGDFLNALASFSEYRYITNPLEWVSIPYPSSQDLDIKLNKRLDKMLESLWEVPVDEIRLGDNAVYTPVYLYGYKLLMAVPSYRLLEEGTLYIPKKASLVNSSASSCSGCSGSCKLKSVKFGAVIFCDGCDSGCTLSTESSNKRIKI